MCKIVDTRNKNNVTSRPVTTVDKINRVQARFQTNKGQEQTTIDMLCEIIKDMNDRLIVAENKINSLAA